MALLSAIVFWAFFIQYRILGITENKIAAVRDRVFATGVKAIAFPILTILGANRAFEWGFPPGAVLAVLLSSLIILATPSMYWLYTYYSGKFGDNESANRP